MCKNNEIMDELLFTTQKQSNYLLQLGVPRHSADCYNGVYATRVKDTKVMVIDNSGTRYKVISRPDIVPVWSAGRLVTMFELCTNCKFERESVTMPLIEDAIKHIEKAIKGEYFDFSKLD